MSNEHSISRRSFVGAAGALGAVAAIGGSMTSGGYFAKTDSAIAEPEETVVWGHCNVNCGGSCALRFHIKDDEIIYVESDNTGDDANDPQRQMRACLRGRSIRRWLQSPDRLNYPMKRQAGAKRGEGKFERISWDEALDTIASEMKRVYDTYGAEAVHPCHCTGVINGQLGRSPDGAPLHRLMNLMGGFLGLYGSYSQGQYLISTPYLLGAVSNFGGVRESNFYTLKEGSLVVTFGFNPAENRMSGGGLGWDFVHLTEERHCRVISIDPRCSDTVFNRDIEWIPIRPGTDAALVAAIAYELIENGWVAEDFLHKYCVGFDEETLPESAKGKHASYKDYVLGLGKDGTPKTPEWASQITRIPADRIKLLAKELAEAESVFITQGWGLQRRSNGELGTLSVCTLPMLLGQAGRPGTNSGGAPSCNGWFSSFAPFMFPVGKNSVKATIPCFGWTEAIDHGEEMTALNAGIRGAEKLNTGIKFLFLHAGNILTNQNSDINATHDILCDESKCEFIVISEIFMTDSAKYADILLPGTTMQEQLDFAPSGYQETVKAVTFSKPVYGDKFERRHIFDVCCDLADRLGVYEEFCDGKYTAEEWLRYLYGNVREKLTELPTFDEGFELGVYRSKTPPDELVGMRSYFEDPEANPLSTPSGKVEIYSEQLAAIADTWELKEDEVVSPIPIFDPGFDQYADLSDEYPLEVTSFQYKASTHSSYGNNRIIQASAPTWLWINPVDAEPRGIENGDTVRVFNSHGEIRIKAKVTDRIIPGVVSMPAGSWHNADMEGDRIDYGGCVNTLTGRRPSPLTKQNPQGSNVGQVEKVGE